MKTKLFFKLIVSILLISILSLNAQTFRKTATAGFVFLEIPINARYTALGDAGISLSDFNSDGIFINPAITGYSNLKHSITFSYSPYFAEIKNYSASYSYNSKFGSLSFGIIYFNYGMLSKTQKVAGQKVYEIIGTFNPYSAALLISYSKMLTDKFSFGVNLKYASENIDIYSANNFMIDGGILYFTGFKSLRFAAVIQNFGTNAKFINDPFKMPTTLKLGTAFELIGDLHSELRLTAILEAIHPNDGDEKLSTGLELSYKNLLILRSGYKFFYDEESYSLGLGFSSQTLFPVSFDFSISNYGRLGNLLRLTLQVGL